jgi:catechol 2,3-dioxygenase
MAVQGINHVALKVRELERSREFYELLGFEESGRRDGMLFFAVRGHHHHVALLEVGPEAESPPRKAVGIMHFAVTVDEEAEIGRLYRLLTEAGYRIVRVIDHRANRSFYVEDPDGNVVEITYDVPKSEWGHLGNPFGQDRPYEIPAEKDS